MCAMNPITGAFLKPDKSTVTISDSEKEPIIPAPNIYAPKNMAKRNTVTKVLFFILDAIKEISHASNDDTDSVRNGTKINTSKVTFLSRFSEYELPWDLEAAFVLLQSDCDAFRQKAATD